MAGGVFLASNGGEIHWQSAVPILIAN
jgi:hypothetical protein